MIASSRARPIVRGTNMKWKTVVIPNCQRERSSVIAMMKPCERALVLGPKVPLASRLSSLPLL